jgi:FkbM family methyltransferase
MKDLIIGSITKLGWDRCEYWVNSINQSGFEGDKIICIFGDHNDLVNNFKNNGFQVYNYRALSDDENICVTRFLAYNDILSHSEQKYRKVLATDVTDVVFQKNPSEFFDRMSDKLIIASSENIRYRDERWGANNMRLSFGDDAYDRMKDRVIYNAGVIAGEHDLISDLFLAIYKMCENRPQNIEGGGGPDQAAYNYLLSLSQFKQTTKFMEHDIGWACQAGTNVDPHKDYSKVNVDSLPKIYDNEIATSWDKSYYIVHQYNRNPVWKECMEKKYKMDNVFLDLGTHFGQGLKAFVQKYNINDKWKVHTFEANPETYNIFMDGYDGIPIVAHNVAVSDNEGTIEISMEKPPTDEGNTGMGSSIIPLDKWQPWDNALVYGNKQEVKCIDFSKFISENFTVGNNIIVKMDIEGSEYHVLERMIEDGTIRYITKLYVEWHAYMFTNKGEMTERQNKIINKLNELNIAWEQWH